MPATTKASPFRPLPYLRGSDQFSRSFLCPTKFIYNGHDLSFTWAM